MKLSRTNKSIEELQTRKMVDREWYRRVLRGLGRIFSQPEPTNTPVIVCEECHHQQSPQTTNEAVLASFMTLNAYLLAIFDDLEKQYWTIRSRGVNVVVTLFMLGSVLGLVGATVWTTLLVLPYLLGLWNLWCCFWVTLERIVNSFDESEGFIHVQAEGETETNDYMGESKDHFD